MDAFEEGMISMTNLIGKPRTAWSAQEIELYYLYNTTQHVIAQVVNGEWCIVTRHDDNSLTTTPCTCKWEAMLKAADLEDLPF